MEPTCLVEATRDWRDIGGSVLAMSAEVDPTVAQPRVSLWQLPRGKALAALEDQPELVLLSSDETRQEKPVASKADLEDPETEYRLAPLFAVLTPRPPKQETRDNQATTVVVVGHTHVCVTAGVTKLRVAVTRAWLGPQAGPGQRSGVWHAGGESDPRLLEALRDYWGQNPHTLPATPRARATTAAKALAENSRNSVSQLRECRYEVERRFGLHLRRELDEDLELVLADVVELLAIVGRARDVARSCVREGLRYWVNDEDMYHAQRGLMDSSLPSRGGREAVEEDPTFSDYDAAVRQCRALDQELSDESEVLRGVLAAGSTIAVTRGAQAQEKFTVLATVSAVALGLPALVLALYGASDYLPFDQQISVASYRLLYPVLAAGLLAAGLAASLPGRGSRQWRFARTLMGVLVVFVLLAIAGQYGP